MYRPSRDNYGQANNCDPATVDYFIKVFGYQEALELSNIDNPTSNRIDSEKIQIALNDAAVLINNYIETAPPQGKLLIAGSYRRTQAILARSYLDSLRPRTHVLEAAEKALMQMELWANKLQIGRAHV
jgi:phage gp36-like protein